jgi:hypothetical protein
LQKTSVGRSPQAGRCVDFHGWVGGITSRTWYERKLSMNEGADELSRVATETSTCEDQIRTLCSEHISLVSA